jgi:hypothetical protein
MTLAMRDRVKLYRKTTRGRNMKRGGYYEDSAEGKNEYGEGSGSTGAYYSGRDEEGMKRRKEDTLTLTL